MTQYKCLRKSKILTSKHEDTYIIDQNQKRIEDKMDNIFLLSVKDAYQEKQLSMTKKLHSQFGHSRSERLVAQ